VGGGMYNINITSFKESRFKSILRQQYDYSCGSASLASLLTFHYEDPVSEQVVFSEMYRNGNQEKITREGFSLLDMKRYLEAVGYQADGFRADLEQLSKTGIPAITIINTKGYLHFVVIKGVTDQQVLVGDPATGTKMMEQEQFESIWNRRVLFVIRNKVDVGRRYFNGDQWKLVPYAPFTMGVMMTRDSLADFNILLPSRSDF
ncbi:MAG: C39 family peptidase, partial [Methylococcaceae bacterium]|nr:C39 family peptidase [Methylococcaceae bacterium]